MHERKALMAELADAFVAVPGGIGTLEELIEVYTWSQLGIHDKACGVLNVDGYYDHLAALLDHAVAEGFLRPQHRAVLSVASEPAELLDRLAAYEPPAVGKWLELDETLTYSARPQDHLVRALSAASRRRRAGRCSVATNTAAMLLAPAWPASTAAPRCRPRSRRSSVCGCPCWSWPRM